jgi:predicted nucleic acid-binding protein
VSSRIYLDSCVVIYLLEGEVELSRAVEALIREAAAETELCVSDLTRLECRVAPIRRGDADLLEKYDRFFTSKGIAHLALGSPVFDLATEVRAHHGTKTPDAIHLAAALLGECGSFWTNDRRLSSAAKGRIEIRVVP